MMMKRLLQCSTAFVLLTTVSVTGYAATYFDDRGGSICTKRDLYVLNPSNIKDVLYDSRGGIGLNSGDVVLHNLTREGETEAIGELLKAGIEPNPANDLGITPLGIAAALNQADIVTLLLDAGVDANWTSKNEHYPCQTTPLHWAAYLGHTDVMKILLDAGADKNAAAKNGQKPLDWGNFSGQIDAVLMLLKAGKPSGSAQDSSKKIVVPE